ncbi:MAG: HupE/UreJ family protein [Gemmatimonadetes bacterium]|nr:HupE/UreJ family protein [Gemmatimonadota bacterium]
MHEIPAHVTVVVFIKPENARLRLLVRAPLEAMRDMIWPTYGPGYLELDRLGDLPRDAANRWIANYIELHEDDEVLPRPDVIATRITLPSDRSFGNWAEALAHVVGPPLPPDTELPWQQALLDVLLEVPITSDSANFSIRPELAHLGIRTATVLRFDPPGGGERAFRYVGNPGLVRLDPRWHHAFFRFVAAGFIHILDGIDHLLFVLCLVIPFRRLRPLVVIVTSFTIAHSITLITSALGLAPDALWFAPLIETLIALSIVWMAFENIAGARLERRWLFAFAFGLVHGFGFSFLLRDSLQFAGSHLVTSLLAFNVGVELGQLLAVIVTVPLLDLLFRKFVNERIGIILLSALVAHEAWHWMGARAGQLRQFAFRPPALDLVLLLGVMRALMLLLIVIGVGWLLHGAFGRVLQREAGAPEAAG